MLIKASSLYLSLVKPILTYCFLSSTTSAQPGPSVLMGVTMNTCWAFLMYQAPLKIFTYVHSVNPHNKPTQWRLLLTPLHKWEKSGTERISNRCKVTQLVSGRAVIWTLAAWLQSSPTGFACCWWEMSSSWTIEEAREIAWFYSGLGWVRMTLSMCVCGESISSTVMGWLVCPQNLFVEVLTPVSQNLTIFGDMVFKEVIKLKWGHSGGS